MTTPYRPGPHWSWAEQHAPALIPFLSRVDDIERSRDAIGHRPGALGDAWGALRRAALRCSAPMAHEWVELTVAAYEEVH